MGRPGEFLSEPHGDVTNRRIAFVQSCWHKEIVDQCRDAFLNKMRMQGCPEQQIDCLDVPGAFELPLYCKILAETKRYSAIIAAGLIVNGGIYRHEFVGNAVVNGLMSVQLDCRIPILSAVLTPLNFDDSSEGRKFFMEHLAIKGSEVAEACLHTVRNLG